MRSAPLLVLLAGCASMTPLDRGRAPAPDWPALTESVVVTTPAAVAERCPNSPYQSRDSDKDCVVVNFARGTCTIYVTRELAPLLEHARGHCAGYDHPGASTMHDAWARFKARAAR